MGNYNNNSYWPSSFSGVGASAELEIKGSPLKRICTEINCHDSATASQPDFFSERITFATSEMDQCEHFAMRAIFL